MFFALSITLTLRKARRLYGLLKQNALQTSTSHRKKLV